MDHHDHVELLRHGVTGDGTWADFGAGDGAFTLALAELLGPGGVIYAVDKDARALHRAEEQLHGSFPNIDLRTLTADFQSRLDLPPLDGIVTANSLHFLRRKGLALRLFFDYLRPGGRLIIVEYNVDRGNPWVPHPLSFPNWKKIIEEAGFVGTRLMATHPSRFLREFFSAESRKPEGH